MSFPIRRLAALLAASLVTPTAFAHPGLASAAASLPGEAESAVPRVAVVFDASGSMWGQIDGRAKIEVAREAMGTLVSEWQGLPLELGLVAYGHRRKGDCGDIELVQPIAPLDAPRVLARVQSLTPRGMTPLSQAVLEAAELLKFTENKATVILLSDGIETCGLDPCEVGARLAAQGVDFTAHVIGFDIRSEQDKAQLACLAQATGGRYFDARDTAGLRDAMARAGQASLAAAPPEPPLPRLQLAVNSPVAIAGRVEVAWEGELSPDDMVVIVEKGATAAPSQRIVKAHVDRNPVHLSAPNLPGEYEVVYVVDGYNRNAEAARAPLQVVEAPIVLVPDGRALAASVLTVAWRGPSGDDARIVVVGQGREINPSTVERVVVAEGERVSLRMPARPGRYELAFVGDYYGKADVMLRQPLEVEPFPLEFDVPERVLAGTPFAIGWRGPSGGDERIAILPRGASFSPSAVLSMASAETADAAELNAPEHPGAYDLVFISDYYGRADELARVPLTVQ